MNEKNKREDDLVIGGERIDDVDPVEIKKKPKQKQKQEKLKEKHYVKIVYEDSTRTIATAIVEIVEYENDYTYKENIERCLEEIYEVGGCWIDSETMIPYSRMYSVGKHIVEKPQQEPSQKKKNRGQRRRSDTQNKQTQKPQKPQKPMQDKKTSGILDLS